MCKVQSGDVHSSMLGLSCLPLGAISFYAGLPGALALIAYTVQHIVLALIFMIALAECPGSITHGREDRPDRLVAGWVGSVWSRYCFACAAQGNLGSGISGGVGRG